VVSALVRTELVEGIGVISYNRPEKHNALNNAMSEQYAEALTWALSDREVRCIVLRGEGPSFSSGRDVTELGSRPDGEGDYSFVRRIQEGTFRLLTSPKPVIAAVKGYALGGAFERCLAADIRIGSPDAVMGLPEIAFGILPDTGGTQLLTALVGPGRAKELVLTGRRIDAQEALSWGILNRIVALEELDAEVMELAGTIASRSPVALAMGKHLVDQCWADEIHRGVRAELLAQTALFTSEDYAEARAALREQRPPKFLGK
jgi:enoyl-CoA hydratase/carnithine racemase